MQPIEKDESKQAFLDRWFTSQSSIEQVITTVAEASEHGVDADLNEAAVRRINAIQDQATAEQHGVATNRADQRAMLAAHGVTVNRPKQHVEVVLSADELNKLGIDRLAKAGLHRLTSR